MSAKTARILRVLFYAYVAVTFVHIAYVVYREPYAFDAWNVSVDTDAQPGSIGRFFRFWYQQYTESNPRIGQPLTYLAYKWVGVAEIGSALAFFAIVIGAFVVGTGRMPDRRKGRDLATLAIGIGVMWFAAPNFPSYLFCRAYATNYVWTSAIVMWFVAALRLHDPLGSVSWRKVAAFGLFGLVVGMCNEHVGPTTLLFVAAYAYLVWRKHRVRAWSVWAAAGGILVGYALLFFAPGQNTRYDEFMSDNYTLIQRVVHRGLSGNLDIFKGFLLGAAPLMVFLLAVIVIAILAERRTDEALVQARVEQRSAVTVVALALLAGVLMTATVFASPKLGPRFFMHPILFLLAGSLGVCSSFLSRGRSFAGFVIMAVLASAYAFGRTVPSYTQLSRESDARLAALAAAPKGSIFTASAWDIVNETWWHLGDDFRDQKKRELVARYFGLDRVLFRGSDAWATLGVSDVKLVIDYQFAAENICLDKTEGLEIKPFVGRDVRSINHAFLDAIAEVHRLRSERLASADLVVAFLGERPPMPSKRLLVGHWADGSLESHFAVMNRGSGRDRKLVLSPELRTDPWDVYMVRIGDEPKLLGKSTEQLVYQPWKSGIYWAIACKADRCFVIFTANHRL